MLGFQSPKLSFSLAPILSSQRSRTILIKSVALALLRGSYFFYPETLVKDFKSQAWIRFFIRICEDLIFGVFFHSCAKFAFLSGFHYVQFGFFIWIWIRSKFFGAMTESEKKANFYVMKSG